jgi:hypothetical protein
MRLAESAGRLHEWREIGSQLTPQQLAELQAYRQLYPWPDEREDIRGAWFTAMLMSAWGKDVDVGELWSNLAGYMDRIRDSQSGDDVLSPNATAMALMGAIPRF